MSLDYDETCTICLKEMFKRVGMKYPNKKFTDQPNWFTKKTWTETEEKDFKKWMEKLLKKRYKHWTKRTLDKEIGMFLLMWGWKTDYKNKDKK